MLEERNDFPLSYLYVLLMDLIKGKDFLMDRFFICFLSHSLGKMRFNKKPNPTQPCVFLGSSSSHLVGFLMGRHPLAGHVWVCTVCHSHVAVVSCLRNVFETQGEDRDHPLLVLYFFLCMSVIFIGTFSEIRSVMVSVSKAALVLYTNQMMFLIISAF